MRICSAALRAITQVRFVSWSMRLAGSPFQRKLRRVLFTATVIGAVVLSPEMSLAQGLLDFFFNGGRKQQRENSFFDDVFKNSLKPPPQPPLPALEGVASSGPS